MTTPSRPISAQVAYLTAGPEQRVTRRRAVNFAALLDSEGVSSHPVSVLDISEQGFRIASEAQVAEDCSMLIKLPGLEAMRARVVWSRDGQLGCEFEDGLHPANLEVLIGQTEAGKGRLSQKTHFGTKGL